MGSQWWGRTARRSWCGVAALVALSLATACSSGGAETAVKARARPASGAAATSVAPSTAPVTIPVTIPVTAPVTTLATGAPAPPSTTGAPSPVDRLVGVGSAQQVITVIAGGYGQTTATFTAYQRVAGGWQVAYGPWEARVGFNGFASPGAKREGDGRTPSGAYGFDFFFGVDADPGVHFPYRVVTSSAIVWDDDPASPLYNEWVDTTSQSAGAEPEPMYNTPAYSHGAVIAYNDARTPGWAAPSSCTSRPAARRRDVCHCPPRSSSRSCGGSTRRSSRAS